MSAARMKRIERAQMRVLFTTPFFAPGVAKLPVVLDDTIDTACTDGEQIRFSPAFLDKLSDPELCTVLCHEVAHCMLGHLWRVPSGADWDVWNQATDHAVNLMLKDFSELVMAKRLADPFPFPKPADAYCANPAFKGMAEEVIYAQLARMTGSGGNGKGKAGKGGSGGKPGSGQPAPGSMPSFGQMSKPANSAGQQLTKATFKQLQTDWTATLLQSAKIAAGQGNLPGNLERLVDGIVKPKIDWADILRSWLREQCADDWCWTRPSLEWEGSGFILPSLHSEKMGPVVFATDTSGSVGAELLAKFRAEKQACLDDMRPSKLVDIYCDAGIQAVDEYCPGDTIGHRAPGGGGTVFTPVFQHALKMPERPKCIVYLTDLMGTFPADPGIPTIWVTWEKSGTAPFGEVIFADE